MRRRACRSNSLAVLSASACITERGAEGVEVRSCIRVSERHTNQIINTHLVLCINPCIKLIAQDHHAELLLDRLPRYRECGVQAVKGHARERDEVLDNALAPD